MKRAVESASFRLPRATLGRRRHRQFQWLRRVTDLVLPPRCAVCEQLVEGFVEPLICQACQDELVEPFDSSCPTCGGQRKETLSTDDFCSRCRGLNLPFRSAVALGDYHKQLRQVVISMKHRGQECLTIQVGHLLGQRIQRLPDVGKLDFVAPIPIHWMRHMLRGANVASLLVEGVHRQTQLPVRQGLLRYKRPTQKQGTLSTPQRYANVRGAIELARRASLEGSHVLLVDDVMTSCATVCEAGKVLRRAGAMVDVAIVARGGSAT